MTPPAKRPSRALVVTREALERALAARPAREEPSDAERAGVALVLAPSGSELALLFIRRAVRAGDPWSGQVALPGGRAAPRDADLVATAVRETQEEVGVDLRDAGLLGALDDVAPRTPVLPPIVVRPFVFALARRPRVTPGAEVRSAFWVALRALSAPGVRRDVTLSVRGVARVFPAFVVGRDVIWGMTERILASLFAALSQAP